MADETDDLVKTLRKPFETAKKWLDKIPGPKTVPEKKVDSTWHNEMLQKANESFRKASSSKASSDPKLGQGKKTQPAKKKAQAAKKRQ